jgi:hypothetical protein
MWLVRYEEKDYDISREIFLNRFVRNMMCDPAFNVPSCDWDGGDCCLPMVDLTRCYVGGNCSCHFTGKVHPKVQEGKV